MPTAPEGAVGMTLSINAKALICRVSRLENDGSDHFPAVSVPARGRVRAAPIRFTAPVTLPIPAPIPAPI